LFCSSLFVAVIVVGLIKECDIICGSYSSSAAGDDTIRHATKKTTDEQNIQTTKQKTVII
jgi:hypothetical protein